MSQARPPRLMRGGFFMGNDKKKLLVIDNYDSFTYNLVQMFMRFDMAIEVHRSDKLTVNDAIEKTPDYLLISPGPRDPAHAGISIALVRALFDKIPIFGVCLGMQCINEAFGGKTDKAPLSVHGKTSMVRHDCREIFKGVPSPFKAARYHSLMTLPDATVLKVTSRSDDGVIMGLSHPDFPVHGVQFHPESFMTEFGFKLVENFLNFTHSHRT